MPKGFVAFGRQKEDGGEIYHYIRLSFRKKVAPLANLAEKHRKTKKTEGYVPSVYHLLSNSMQFGGLSTAAADP
ncbi:hypothetical protein ACVLD2_000782 [Paenibacillus sp. PvR052]